MSEQFGIREAVVRSVVDNVQLPGHLQEEQQMYGEASDGTGINLRRINIQAPPSLGFLAMSEFWVFDVETDQAIVDFELDSIGGQLAVPLDLSESSLRIRLTDPQYVDYYLIFNTTFEEKLEAVEVIWEQDREEALQIAFFREDGDGRYELVHNEDLEVANFFIMRGLLDSALNVLTELMTRLNHEPQQVILS